MQYLLGLPLLLYFNTLIFFAEKKGHRERREFIPTSRDLCVLCVSSIILRLMKWYLLIVLILLI